MLICDLSMQGERKLTTGLSAKGASFLLIVSGAIGVREIDRLTQKLQINKEILADIQNDAEIDAIVQSSNGGNI